MPIGLLDRKIRIRSLIHTLICAILFMTSSSLIAQSKYNRVLGVSRALEYHYLMPVNDSLCKSVLGKLGNTDSFHYSELNVYTRTYRQRRLVHLFNKGRFRSTVPNVGSLNLQWTTDIYGRHYLLSKAIDSMTNKAVTIYSRIDTNFNVLWSYRVPGELLQNVTMRNQTIDSFLYFGTAMRSGISDSDHNLLFKIKPNGDIALVKRVPKTVGAYIYLRDTFLHLYTDSNRQTICSPDFMPIRSIQTDNIGNAAGLMSFGHDRPVAFAPLHTSTMYADAFDLLDGWFYNFQFIHFYTPDLKYRYNIRGSNFHCHNLFAYQVRRNGKIDVLISTDKTDPYFGIRHLVIASDKKTVEKHKFYPLPKHRDSINAIFSGCGNLAVPGSGGFINDSFLFLMFPSYVNSSQSKDDLDIITIKNDDYSIFPYAQDICTDDIYIDSVAQIPRSNPVFRDATVTRDTFAHSFTLLPWTYYNFDTFHFQHPGALKARFRLDTHSYCGTRINLRSDTMLKHGESRWTLRYLDTNFSETFIKKDTLNLPLKRAGRVEISHYHTLMGCRDSFKDTVFYSRPFSYSIARDTPLCPPVSYKMNAKNNSFHSYLWSTASTDTAITATDTGTYWVRKTGVCGSFTDTIKLRWKTPLLTTPVFSLDSLILCGNSLPYTLSSNITGASYTYTWNPAHVNSSSRSLSSFGNYRLTITDNCHTYMDSFRLISKVVAIPPSHPDSIALCTTTYKITRPQNLRLEEKFGSLWLSKDSILLSKNEKKTFRWTDSCGTETYDSIYDYQRGSFPSLPKSQKLCETFASFAVNTNPTIQQYEFVTSWLPNNNINLQLGPNYIRRDDNCGNQQFDTILGYSTKTAKNIITPDSLVLCPQEFPYTLTISDTFRTYLWSNGDNLHYSKLKIKNSKFYLTVTDDCYLYTDSIEVREITTLNEIALEDIYRELCKALEKTRVETKLVYPKYIWNQTPSTKFFYIADTSQNLVTLYIPRRCDTLKDSLPLSWIDPALLPPSYTVDSSYCKQAEGAVKLTLTSGNDYLSYQWKGDSLPYIFVNTYAKTRFYARNLCYEKYFDLPPYICPLDPIGLPQAFSPNGDNLNDSWGLQGAKNIILYNLSIFNRWGEKIFETTDPNIQWNGSFKGEPAPTGIYGYTLDYEYTPQSIRRVQSGEVMVVR